MEFQVIAADSRCPYNAVAQYPTSLPKLHYLRAHNSPDFSPWKHNISKDTQNEYWVLKDKTSNLIITYGFLRGWDEGWDDICLGIVVLPEHQHHGHGRYTCKFLLNVARTRKLKRVRLHVHPSNKAALRLYRKLGFVFDGKIREDGELIGWFTL